MTARSHKLPAVARPDPREMGPHGLNGHAGDEVIPRHPKIAPVDHPIAQHALAALRNPQTPPKQFRAFSQQLLVLLVMEATRSLPLRPMTVDAEKDRPSGHILAKPVVFLSVTRDGLGLAHDVAEFIPDVSVGAISIERRAGADRIEPRLHLTHAPALHEVRVMLFDPVVEKGLSASIALNLVRRSGATDISLLSFVISAQGLRRVQDAVPEAAIWTAGIEREYDPEKGRMPGIGRFAERLYG